MASSNTVSKRLKKLINNVAQDFSLEKLSKSPARFDLQKLTWFNRQYISMMGLGEFVTRAQNLKLEKKTKDLKLRVGDYLYLVDLETQKTFVQIMEDKDIGVDGFLYHQLGGGREDGEDSISCLIREVSEETNGKLKIDPNKLVKIFSYEISYSEPKLSQNPTTNQQELYDGKEHNVYFYEIKENEIQPLTNSEGEYFEWRDLVDVLALNQYITYSVWKEFCLKNDFECVKPNHRILERYLGYQLDKNRANSLTDLETEGDIILDWKKPDKNEIAWKKITIEESCNNLKEIKLVIENIYNNSILDIKQKQKYLYQQVQEEIYFNKSNIVEKSLQELASVWESELKNWISADQKNTGEYFWPLRVALSGKQKSPSPFEILAILDQETTLSRLDI